MQHVFVLYMMHQTCKNVLIMFIMVFLGFLMKSAAIYMYSACVGMCM